MQLLEDYNVLSEYEILKENTSDGKRKYALQGVFSKCDTPNKNKRVYPKYVMEKVIDGLQSVVESGGMLGELNHPSNPQINLDKVSHKITKLGLAEDGSIIGRMEPAGPRKNDLISLLEDGIRLGVSTRGTGAVKPYNGPLGEGLVEVQENYVLRGIDIVHEPSFSTFPEKIMESTEDKFLFASPSNFKAIWDEVFK